MRVLLVSEGAHEFGKKKVEGALQVLTRKLMNKDVDFECEKVSSSNVHLHPGKADGYTRRALGWIRYAERKGFDALVLVIDQDGQKERGRQLQSAQEDLRLPLPRAMGVAIRTFDAWMLRL
jgi:hypothetical protein